VVHGQGKRIKEHRRVCTSGLEEHGECILMNGKNEQWRVKKKNVSIALISTQSSTDATYLKFYSKGETKFTEIGFVWLFKQTTRAIHSFQLVIQVGLCH
jgi:hypothetical protein